MRFGGGGGVTPLPRDSNCQGRSLPASLRMQLRLQRSCNRRLLLPNSAGTSPATVLMVHPVLHPDLPGPVCPLFFPRLSTPPPGFSSFCPTFPPLSPHLPPFYARFPPPPPFPPVSPRFSCGL